MEQMPKSTRYSQPTKTPKMAQEHLQTNPEHPNPPIISAEPLKPIITVQPIIKTINIPQRLHPNIKPAQLPSNKQVPT